MVKLHFTMYTMANSAKNKVANRIVVNGEKVSVVPSSTCITVAFYCHDWLGRTYDQGSTLEKILGAS